MKTNYLLLLSYCSFISLLFILLFPSFSQAQKRDTRHIRGVEIERLSPSCYGKADGSISIKVNDGGVHSFLWSNGGTSHVQRLLEAGTYFVTITSKSGKQMVKDITLKNPNRLFIRDYHNLGGGKFEGVASGGTSPYSYASGSVFVIGAEEINEQSGEFNVVGGEQMEVFYEQITEKIRADIREKAVGKILIEIPYVMVTDINGCTAKKYLTIKKDTIPTPPKPIIQEPIVNKPESKEISVAQQTEKLTPKKRVEETVTELDTRFGIELPVKKAEKAVVSKTELSPKVAPAYEAKVIKEEEKENKEDNTIPQKTAPLVKIPTKTANIKTIQMASIKKAEIVEKQVITPQKVPIPKLIFNQRKIPEKLGERTVKAGKRVYIRSPKVELQVWDSETVDGDTISLFFNGEWLLQNYALKKSKKKIALNIDLNGDNYLVLYAHNEGSRPPNTAALTVFDGKKERRVAMSASVKVCDSVHFKLLE